MTEPGSRILGYLLWAVCLIPLALFAMAMGWVEWSWRGFAVAWAIYAAILLSYGWLVNVVQRAIDRRTAKGSGG